MSIKSHALKAILLILACSAPLANAQTGQPSTNHIRSGYQSDNLVEVKAWVGSEKKDKNHMFAPTQQVLLYIDLSTPRWFLGATDIGNIEIPNLIVKRRKTFATNYTEIRKGHTWVHQRWEITLYPQSSGEYTLPPIPITVNIAGENGRKTQGELWTKKINFQVHLPDGSLTTKDKWVAASSLKATQEWDQNVDKLKVGDAITRSIDLKAQDSLSILLPQVLTQSSTKQYQGYADPPKLVDNSARGDYISTRTDKVVYVIQDGGDIHFPDYQVKWWNTKTNKLETITLPGKTFHAKHTLTSFLKAYWSIIISILSVVIIIILLVGFLKRFYKTHPKPLVTEFYKALRQKDFARARLLLYVKLKKLTQFDTFSQTEQLKHIGDEVATEAKTSLIGHWKAIKPTAQKRYSNYLTPMKLQEKLDEIDRH